MSRPVSDDRPPLSHEASDNATEPDRTGFSAALLDWYDRHGRDLPWRIHPRQRATSGKPDPYRVWLSEIMLQQTTVQAVKPYFARFLDRWPNVAALAAADTSEVMSAWSGLGYYSRARNLHAAARAVADTHDGHFPAGETSLRALPGIGEYTAAAIASIAFNEPAVVIDGNIERVVSRYGAIDTPLPKAKGAIRAFLAERLPDERPGDFAQAMMDLGATICTPKKPACILCPLQSGCAVVRSRLDPLAFPVKPAKKPKPVRLGAAYVAERASDGALLLTRRPETGMLAGMSAFPSTNWSSRGDGETGMAEAPLDGEWIDAGSIEHGFTHFTVRLNVFHAKCEPAIRPADAQWWCERERLAEAGLPTLMLKVLRQALPDWDTPER